MISLKTASKIEESGLNTVFFLKKDGYLEISIENETGEYPFRFLFKENKHHVSYEFLSRGGNPEKATEILNILLSIIEEEPRYRLRAVTNDRFFQEDKREAGFFSGLPF